MKISELIEHLKDAKLIHGDIDVKVYDAYWNTFDELDCLVYDNQRKAIVIT